MSEKQGKDHKTESGQGRRNVGAYRANGRQRDLVTRRRLYPRLDTTVLHPYPPPPLPSDVG